MEGDTGSWYGGSGWQSQEWSPDRGLACVWNKSIGKGSPQCAAFNNAVFQFESPPIASTPPVNNTPNLNNANAYKMG